MGVYTKHRIKILSPHTVGDLVSLRDMIWFSIGLRFRVYDTLDEINDNSWNDGNGAKWYDIDTDVRDLASNLPPDMEVEIYCICDESLVYRYILSGGKTDYLMLYCADDEEFPFGGLRDAPLDIDRLDYFKTLDVNLSI